MKFTHMPLVDNTISYQPKKWLTTSSHISSTSAVRPWSTINAHLNNHLQFSTIITPTGIFDGIPNVLQYFVLSQYPTSFKKKITEQMVKLT